MLNNKLAMTYKQAIYIAYKQEYITLRTHFKAECDPLRTYSRKPGSKPGTA